MIGTEARLHQPLKLLCIDLGGGVISVRVMILKGLVDRLDVGGLSRCGRECSERQECKDRDKSDRLAAPSRSHDIALMDVALRSRTRRAFLTLHHVGPNTSLSSYRVPSSITHEGSFFGQGPPGGYPSKANDHGKANALLAGSGHAAAAPPSSVMKSRRLMPDMGGFLPSSRWPHSEPS